jgi:hypothetical protein
VAKPQDATGTLPAAAENADPAKRDRRRRSQQ